MKPELVVLDLAGTTVHDNKDVHKILQRLFKKMRIRISLDDANEVMGIPKPVAIRILLEKFKYPYISQTLIDEMHSHFILKMSDFYTKHKSVKEKSGASHLFRKLKSNGIKIYVDTGFDRAIVNPLLQRMNWGDLIDGSITSDEVVRGRPHPDLIFRAMTLAGVKDARRVAKVGDTLSDLQEGHAAGCGWVIGITDGAYSSEQLMKGPHTHLINSLDELPAILLD